MRIALKNQQEVAHVWAQQIQYEGRAANMFFRDKSIYSYGTHFEIARFITDDVVFFNCRKYSSSTAKHQSYTARAISHKTMFSVPSMENHNENMEYFLKEIEKDLLAMMRGRAENVEWRHTQIKRYLNQVSRYVALFGTTLTKDQKSKFKSIFARRDNLLSVEFQAKMKEKIKAQTAATKIRNAEIAARKALELEEARKDEAEDLAKWLAGENTYHLFFNSPVHLRIKDAIIQTSKGAEVPLIEARKLWHALQLKQVVSGMRVGHYTVTGCDAVNLTVGCHVIPLKEVLRMAVKLGWMNEVLA